MDGKKGATSRPIVGCSSDPQLSSGLRPSWMVRHRRPGVCARVIASHASALLSASDMDQTETSDAALRESLKKRMDFTHSVMEKVYRWRMRRLVPR